MRRHLRYISYLARHKWFVLRAGLQTKASLWRLLKHDWSKALPSEWKPYARYFYGAPPDGEATECIRTKFDRAWLRHLHRNDHHWQHWVLREDDGATICLEIPEAVVREMVADWMGAGRASRGKWCAAAWYMDNHMKIQMHPESRYKVEILLLEMHAKGMA